MNRQAMRRGLGWGLTLVLLLLALGTAVAAPPPLIRYQAHLTDMAGVPLTGLHDLTFTVFDQEAGGGALWTEGPMAVDVGSGTLDILLGQVSPIPSSALTGPDRWLEVEVDAAVLVPRQRLASVPYAMVADRLGTMTLSQVQADTNSRIASHAAFSDAHREHGSLEESAEIDSDIAVHASFANAHREHASLEESSEIDGDIAVHAASADAHREHASLEETVEFQMALESYSATVNATYVKKAGDTMTNTLYMFPASGIALSTSSDVYTGGLVANGSISSDGDIVADWDLTANGGDVRVGNTNAAVHLSNTGSFGAAATWDPNPSSANGLFLEHGLSESGGFYADGDVAAIWSPGDPDILRVYDEDSLPSGDPLFVIDGVGYVGIRNSNPTNILTVEQYSPNDPIADSWGTYSSRRWKDNIRTLDGALAAVSRLRGVSFDWKGNGQHDIGLIAEEVGEVIPEVVAYEDDGADARSVDYARLVAVLIEAVKEQQQEIERLQTAVEALEAGNR